MILYMYIALGQGLTTPGDKILMSTETSCHFGHLLQVSKQSLCSLTLYNIFHDCMHVYSPGAGADSPQGTKFMSTEVSCHFIHLLQVSKNVLYNFFHDLIHVHVYSPGAGQTAPRAQNFDVNRKALLHYPFVASFKEISSKSDFIQFFTCI